MRRHETSPHALSPGRIARFWLPLEATWLMMAAEGPFLAAVIARLPVPKENLAAFAVASALAWIVESPIITTKQTALRNFMLLIANLLFCIDSFGKCIACGTSLCNR